MAEQPTRDQFQPDDELFEAIQRFLAEQSSDTIDAELRRALSEARRFIDQELRIAQSMSGCSVHLSG